MVTEQMWTQGIQLLSGKDLGHRVLVWANYDMISLHKVFFIAERERSGPLRLTQRDFPVPVFWDEKTPAAAERLLQLDDAIKKMNFEEFPMNVPSDGYDYGGYGYDGWYGDSECSDDSLCVENGDDEEEEMGYGYEEDSDYECERDECERDECERDECERDEDSVDDDYERDEEKQENPREYLQRQFESFLTEMDDHYHPIARQTFQQRVDDMVQALYSQRKTEF
jgi:hypothetical protein